MERKERKKYSPLINLERVQERAMLNYQTMNRQNVNDKNQKLYNLKIFLLVKHRHPKTHGHDIFYLQQNYVSKAANL